MTAQTKQSDLALGKSAAGIWTPLETPLFRRIWVASAVSNFGLFIQAVGAAWAMTQLTPNADMVALVQTALMLPIMLFAIPAGAIADMYDRRLVGLRVLSISLAGGTVLTILSYLHMVTPEILLLLCFTIASGTALFGPAWQAAVAEQVPEETLPQAVALNSISYNIARSFGPAIGGIIIATAGIVVGFALNALLYLPLLGVLYAWRREAIPSRLPPERMFGAIGAGIRYVMHSPPLRIVLWRTFATGIAGGSVSALIPLVARDLLNGDAQVYGLILGAFGVGSVAGALLIAKIRSSVSDETTAAFSAPVLGLMVGVVAISKSVILTVAALFVAGTLWMVVITLFNVAIQLSAPRWVAGRTVASFQAAIAGGIAIGSWFWGYVAQNHGVATALIASGAVMMASAILGRWLPLPEVDNSNKDIVELADPEVKLAVTSRSGPIVVELVYRIDPADARDFYRRMQKVQLARSRNGAYGWSIARDLEDPWIWTERFHTPTWLDYLRQRNRHTTADKVLHQEAIAYHRGDEPIRIRRMLERPFGSVRWKEDAPDPHLGDVLPL